MTKQRTDTERLDWWEENYASIGRLGRSGDWEIYVYLGKDEWSKPFYGVTARQAIDAAMDADAE